MIDNGVAAIERMYRRWLTQDVVTVMATILLAISSETLLHNLDQWSRPFGGWADQALVVIVCMVPALVRLVLRGRILLTLVKEKEDLMRDLFDERQRADRMEGALVTIRTLHHEVNNPLQAILGALDLWDPKIGTQDEQEEAWTMIRQASEEILAFTRRIGRISSEGELVTRPTAIGDLLEIPETRS